MQSLSAAILELLKNMLGPEFEAVEEALMSTLLTTRNKTEEAGSVGGNIASVLGRCNPLVFKGRDLSFTNLSNAVFFNADLTGTRLTGANLKHASFNNATLDDGDLQNADLTGANFNEMGAVHSLAFSSDGSKLATGGTDSNIHVWNVSTGEELLTIRGHTAGVTSVCWGPNDEIIASGSADQSVVVWDSDTGERRQQAHNIFPNWITGVAFSPLGEELAISGGLGSGGIKLWRWQTEKEPVFLFQYPAQTNNVCYSPDGLALASSVWDRGYASQQFKAQVRNALLVTDRSAEPTIIKSEFKRRYMGYRLFA